jgi:hypothetical protein
MLEDGTYDIIIVDATPTDDEPGALRLDVTVLGGAHKGQVISVRATGLGLSDVEALGMPGTLVVSGGEPSVVVEP